MNERPMLVEKQFKVNAYDIDVMGIVSNIVYIRWFEDLRFALMDAWWPYEQMLASGQSPILARTEADYRRPVTFFDRPIGTLWMAELTRSRWTVELEIACGDKAAARGRQIGYFYDIEKRRPVPIPEALLEKYRRERGE